MRATCDKPLFRRREGVTQALLRKPPMKKRVGKPGMARTPADLYVPMR
jgi:hypothetical protein